MMYTFIIYRVDTVMGALTNWKSLRCLLLVTLINENQDLYLPRHFSNAILSFGGDYKVSHGTGDKGKTNTMQGKISFLGNVRRNPTAYQAATAQLGERQTEDLKVPGLIPGLGIFRSSSNGDAQILLPEPFGVKEAC